VTDRQRAADKGATMVEALLAIPLFIAFLLVAFDFLRLCYCQLSLQYALTQAAREAVAAPAPTLADARNLIGAKLAGLGLQLEAADILTVCPLAEINNVIACPAGSYIPGQSRDLVAYRLTKSFRVFFLGTFAHIIRSGQVTITVTVMGRNEPV